MTNFQLSLSNVRPERFGSVHEKGQFGSGLSAANSHQGARRPPPGGGMGVRGRITSGMKDWNLWKHVDCSTFSPIVQVCIKYLVQ